MPDIDRLLTMWGVYDELNLLSGERLLWSGKPERRRPFDRSDALPLAFSLLGWVFVIVWIAAAERSGVPKIFFWWAVVIACFGVIEFVGTAVVRFIQLGSTRYAVTDRRVIEIVDRPRRRRVESYLRDLSPPVLRANDTGSTGSVAFGQFPGFQGKLRRNRHKRAIVLRDIEQPRYVRDLIADAQAKVRR